jgi:hypothetical protein
LGDQYVGVRPLQVVHQHCSWVCGGRILGSVVEVREDSKPILVLNRSRLVAACGFGEAFLEGKVEKKLTQ